MAPAPVTKDCGCSRGELCPTAKSLRHRVNETLVETFAHDEERTYGGRQAVRDHRNALREFKRHVGQA